MSRRILFVDDEPNILSGFERLFRKEFAIDTAQNGEEALRKVRLTGPYDVIVSDMRMPGMNGAEMFSKAREIAPQSIRLILTGQADMAAAMQAVNEGAIFRFLMKPCPEPVMRSAIDAALRQFDLQHAERDLLENTLQGAVTVLTEVLSLVNPAAFGRSMRIRKYVHHIGAKLQIADAWQFEIAAMLSQIGCVTLEPETVELIYSGQSLGEEERRRFNQHPGIGHDLLVKVPRLENVANMIARQHEAYTSAASNDVVALGAQALHVALEFDQLVSKGQTPSLALYTMRALTSQYNPQLVDALADFKFDSMTYQAAVMPVARLDAGMIIDEDIRTTTGLLLVARGQEATHPMLLRLRNFRQNSAIPESVRVKVLRPGLAVDTPQLAQQAS